jgi:hypothetical protein
MLIKYYLYTFCFKIKKIFKKDKKRERYIY